MTRPGPDTPQVTSGLARSWQIRLVNLQFWIGLVFAATFVAFCVWARFPVPFRDDWDWLLWLLGHPLTAQSIFEPHNEHLIPLLRVMVALQYQLEPSGTGLVFSVAVLSQLVTGWLCWREARRRWRDPVIGRFITGLAFVCLFVSFQLQSFVFMAAALFPIVQMFATAGFAGMLNASESGNPSRRLWLASAAMASAGAALTTTNGLVVPVVSALLAWRRREHRRVVVAFGLAGAVGVALYLVLVGRPWLHPPAPAGAQWAAPSVGEMAAYFLTFFGSGVAYVNGSVALALGAVLFGAGCYAVLRVGFDRRDPARIELFGAALILFAMASAAMATPARAQFGALQAAQSRYATYAMTYWTGLLLWAASRIGDQVWRRQLRPAVLLATLAATLAAFVAHVFIAVVWKAKADNIAAAGLALEAGVFDDEWIKTLHPINAVVYSAVDRLRAAGDLRFPSAQIGSRFHSPAAMAECAGSLALMKVRKSGHWRAEGQLASAASAGVIVDRAGIVRGLARSAPLVGSPDPREPEVLRTVWQSLFHPASEPLRWLGFVAGGDGPPYTIYLVDDRRQPVCRADLSVFEPVHVWLDAPKGIVGGTAEGMGWAFQCDGAVERLDVLIDDVPRAPDHLETARPRPDVPLAFAGLCDVNHASGFGFQFDTRTLSVGPHTVRVRAFGHGGRIAESNPHTIEVRRR